MQSAFKPLVCIVDDDDMVRTSVCMLAETLNVRTRGFGNCQEFLDSVDRRDCDCLVLDVRLPGISGPALQERLAGMEFVPPIIFISGHGTVPMAVKAMQLGAIDFLLKPFDEQTLLDRIQQAIEQSCQARMQIKEKSVLAARLEMLSEREREVLELLKLGMANKQIADRLNISVRTAEQHRANLKKKLHATSLAELLKN